MAFPTIRAIQTNNTETKYEEYGKAVVSAAKLYVDSYGEDLFDSSTNQKESVYLDQLIKKDLIKDINVSGSTCIDGSSVNVIKYKDDYTYCLNLICKAKGTNKEVYKKVSQEGQCKDLTLYKVTYNISNHDPHIVSVIEGNEHTVINPSTMGFSEANNHKKFDKWKSTQVGEKKPGDKITVDRSIEFNAQLVALSYKVNYKSSIDGVSGTNLMGVDNCTVGSPCPLKANGFSKDYYHFNNYTYNSGSYSPGYNIDQKVNITYDGQPIYVTASFSKNTVTTSYYSNGGNLVPSNSQSCPEYAGCSRSQCVWPQDSKCKGKNGLVFTNTYNFDATSMSVNGVRDYTSAGSLAMTRSGCTQTGKWAVDSATNSTKIIQTEKFATAKDYVNKAGKGTAFKTGNVSINLIAEWDCPSAITCAAGKYLPANSTTCANCTSGNYCLGGTFYKKSTAQGLTKCPAGYGASPVGSKTINQCYMNVGANRYVKTARASSSTACPTGYQSSAIKLTMVVQVVVLEDFILLLLERMLI